MKSTLAPDPGEEATVQRVGSNLTGKIDGQGRVDSDHVVVSGDRGGRIGEIARTHFQDRIVVHPFVEALAPHDERADNLALEEALATPGDHSTLVEVHDVVGEHLRMNTDIFMLVHLLENGARDLADARLDRRSIGNEPRDVAADCATRRVERTPSELGEGFVHRHEVTDSIDRQEARPQSTRHPRIHFRDDELR